MSFSRNYRRNLEKRVSLAQVEQTQRHMVKAEKLQVFRDSEAAKVIMKLFSSYVSETDISDLPAFLQEIDALFVKYRNGNTAPEEEEVEEEGEEEITEEDIPDPASSEDGTKQPTVTKKVVKKVVKKEVEEPEEPVYDSSLARYIAASLAK